MYKIKILIVAFFKMRTTPNNATLTQFTNINTMFFRSVKIKDLKCRTSTQFLLTCSCRKLLNTPLKTCSTINEYDFFVPRTWDQVKFAPCSFQRISKARRAITLPGRKSFYLVVAFPENLFRQTSIRVADALVWKPSIRLFAFL
jgi:hypothetical protein